MDGWIYCPEVKFLTAKLVIALMFTSIQQSIRPHASSMTDRLTADLNKYLSLSIHLSIHLYISTELFTPTTHRLSSDTLSMVT